MTGPCSGLGVGQAKLGFAALQYIGPAAIGGALANLSGWKGSGVGAAIGALTFDLSAFCPGGPPAMPTFTISDIQDILNPFFNTSGGPATQKFRDFLANVFWPILCECGSGASLVPSPAVYPAGGPQSVVVAPITGPTSQGFYPMLSTQTKALGLGCGSPAAPSGWQLPQFDDSSWSFANGSVGALFPIAWAAESGFQNGVAVGVNAAAPGSPERLAPTSPISHNCEQFLLRWKVYLGDITPSLAAARPANFAQADGGWTSGQLWVNGLGGVAVPASALNWQSVMNHLLPNQWNTIALWVNVSNTGSANTWGTDGGVDLALDFTSVIQTVTAAPCCPPDTISQSYLDQILKLVTLIQRQSVPFGYVAGTAHAGLSGAGLIAVQGLIGCRVTITVDSTHLGVKGTSPAELFDRGWITWGNADGALHSTRLERTNQLIFPCDAGVFDTIYYDLNPLLTVTITELLREPG